MDGPYKQTEMTEHLIEAHGLTPTALRCLWERLTNPEVGWDEFLDVNHDLLHALGQGQVVRGAWVA